MTNKLIAELEALCRLGVMLRYKKWITTDSVMEILSRHKAEAQEPLAVLAVRKGGRIHGIDYDDNKKRNPWFICYIWHDGGSGWNMPFWGDTYAEAEAKARKWLNGLEDK